MMITQKIRYSCLILITVLFISALTWFLYLANAGVDHLVFAIMRQIPYGDKVCHICVYGLLALLINLSLRCRKVHLWKTQIYLGSILTLCLVGIEEASQQYLPTRSQDWWDYLASCIGILGSAAMTSYLAKILQIQERKVK